MTSTSPDYSSADYWATRFGSETSFEWLGRSDAVLAALDPVVDSLLPSSSPSSSSQALQILHFGCGTSTLGIDLSRNLADRNISNRVIDADYVASSLPPRGENDDDIPLISLDVLDIRDLRTKSPKEGWDLVLDKSTADAISCGMDLLPSPLREQISDNSSSNHEDREEDEEEKGEKGEEEGESLPPIHLLCDNLAGVTRKGGRWVCISYSSTRFDHLLPSFSVGQGTKVNGSISEGRPRWVLRSKGPLVGGFDSDGVVEKRIPDGKGGERIIWEPETGAWVYVLERV